MTFTPRDLALAAIAAPLPLSRLTSTRTFAPLVIACSAWVCCVALSPSAFWISAGTPARSNAALNSGRSMVSQRTEDFESGSRTATLSGSPPPAASSLPPSSPPHPATTASDRRRGEGGAHPSTVPGVGPGRSRPQHPAYAMLGHDREPS